MMDGENDFFVTGKVIDYLNYKSYVDHKDTCSSSIESKLAVDAGYKDTDGKGKDNFRAGFRDSDRYGS
ncbi:MAG: hypothetical protein IJ711_02440 [Lachnospiraceae bacterium]|nr:hypothetical protein [Lachnospiraceae bacterium]